MRCCRPGQGEHDRGEDDGYTSQEAEDCFDRLFKCAQYRNLLSSPVYEARPIDPSSICYLSLLILVHR
jgi:hypothetical protein